MKIAAWIYIPILIIMNACSPINESLTYLALGDSYTIGESVEEAQRYPVQLRQSMTEAGYEMRMPQIIARTGWTTSELLTALDTAHIHHPYDLVTLLIGVNNQYRGQDINLYREEFQSLLDKSITYAGGIPDHVLVLSIPDWGVTPFAASRDSEKIRIEIDQYNDINKSLSAGSGVRYLDVTAISRQAATDASLLAEDGLHPSGSMYSAWAKLMLAEIIQILED